MRNLVTLWTDPTLRMISVASVLFGLFAASFAPYLSLIAITIFGLDDQAFALQMAAALVVSVTVSVGVGIVTDRHPLRKFMAVFAVVAMVVGLAAVWLVGSVPVFIVVHVVLLPCASTIFGQLFAIIRLYASGLPPDTRDGITSTVRALFAVPFVFALPLWGMAFDAGVPLLSLYPVTLVVALVFLVFVVRYWPADAVAPWTERKSALGFFASLREVLASNVMWRVVWMGTIHSGSTLMGVLLALVFNAASGRGPGDVGLFFGTFVALEIVVMMSVGRLLGTMRRLHIIALGATFYAVFLGLLPVLASTAAVWFLVLPAAIGGGLLYGLTISYLQDLLGERAGAGASLVTLQRMVADGLAAVIFAAGSWIGGYGVAAFMGSATILIGAAMLVWSDRHDHE